MSSNWLSKELSTLLASPHISFPKPPAGIHLGPGPIDLFSTNFNNLFASDVETIVDGEPVSRDDLKQKLLNLQKRWNPEKVKFVDSSSIGPVSPPRFPPVIAPSDLFASRRTKRGLRQSSDPSKPSVSSLCGFHLFVSCSPADLALTRINKEGGNAVIKRFAMSGDPSVFQTP